MKFKYGLLVLALVSVILISLKVGEVSFSWGQLFQILMHKDFSSFTASVIYKIRLPRVLAGLIVGAGLAVSGAIFQSILRNPLAEPYTLGVSGGASLAVAIANLLGLYRFGYLNPIAGWIGALFSILLVYLLSQRGAFSTSSLILAGIVMNFLFSSLVLLLFAFLDPSQLHSTILWLMGDLSSSGGVLLFVGYIIILPALFILFSYGRELDILSLGDEKAISLGMDVKKRKAFFFFLASTITGTCISLSGIIGFVGLLIPHLMRKVFGVNNQRLLLTSAISGAVFLLISDTLARNIISPLELPVGVITGLVGGLFFLSLLVAKGGWEIG
jgi:iron complex transport system permease protein